MSTRQAVLIVHNAAIESDVNDILESVGIDGFTKFPNTLGKGNLSEPHLDSDVWPGVNCGTLVVTDEAKASQLMEQVHKIRERLGTEGVKGFMWQIEQVT